MLATVRLYATGALLLTLLGYGAWESHRATAALEKLDALSAQVTALQAGVDASNQAIAGMQDSLIRVAAKAVTVRERVITMERNDASVKSLLDTPLPADGCMLDDTCSTGIPLGSAPSPVRAASATGQ